MASEEEILKQFDKLKDNKQFAVPEGYFESFADKVMEKVEEDEKPVVQLFRVRTTLAWVASLAALFLLTYTGISILVPSSTNDLLSENEIYAALEHDVYYLDDAQLYDLVQGVPEESTLENLDFTEEEIIDYLIEEGTDIDLLNTDF